MRVTVIGHSTVLIEAAGMKLLTDPYFGLHGNAGYARVRPPARSREDLAGVDLVLVSHNHWDHTDRRFLRLLPETVPVLAPAWRTWITRLKGARNVIGLDPWERRTFGPVQVVATPASHISRTVGFLIEAEGRRVYFAGDTYCGPFMERIGSQMRPDIALMPVTTYRIPMTMGEKGAVAAVRALKPAVVIPIHLGIRPHLRLLCTSQSPEGFRQRLRAAGIDAQVLCLKEGEAYEP